MGLALLVIAAAVGVYAAVTKDDGPGDTQTVGQLAAYSRVAFLGDSYTQGAGTTKLSGRWTTLVAGHYDWVEQNFGVSGSGYVATGRSGLAYQQRIAGVAAARPDAVIVSGGGNDVIDQIGAEQEFPAIRATFARLRQAMPHTVLIAIRPFWPATQPPRYLDQIANTVRSAVEAVGGVYADAGEPLTGRPQDIAADHLHPNDAGHRAIAQAVDRTFAGLRIKQPS